MKHELKLCTKFFDHLVSNEKTAEIRFNDRDYQVGDELHLLDIDEKTGVFTGREIRTVITHVLSGYGLQDGYVMLSFPELKGTNLILGDK